MDPKLSSRSLLRLVPALTAVLIVGRLAPGRAEAPAPKPAVRFAVVHVFADSGAELLAAYQFEFVVEAGDVKVVGVGGGEHAAFRNPPYYDPEALAKGRLILAAFNTGNGLPSGRTRVATLNLAVSGNVEPRFSLKLAAAGNREGKEISVRLTLTEPVR